MKILFIAGYGPIVPDPEASLTFWQDAIGIEFNEVAPEYHHARHLEGAKVFALWPLAQAAQATFGTPEWPQSHPVPQAWIEFELDHPDAVQPAAEELRAAGHSVLIDAHVEPWGQTISRLLSPEGLLVGFSFLPDFHQRT